MTVERIRVLRLIDRLNVGGPALQVSVLAERLDPERFQQVVLAGEIDPHEGDYVSLRAPGLVVEQVRGLGRSPNPFGDAQAALEIHAAIRRFRPHIVHTHKAKAGVLGRPAAWGLRVPSTVHTFHGHLLHGYFSPAKTKAVATVERYLARPTTRLVSVGERVRDELLAAGIGRRHQYTVVAPGVRLGPLPDRAQARAELGLAPDDVVATFVGRLAPVKRPDRFVDVARRLHDAVPDARFLVVGGGELHDDMQLAARALGDRLVLTGWRADMETVYAATDLMVLTSDNEGMPVTLIEAASVGLPAVTTDVGSAGEVVIDGVSGYVTAPDTTALAAAVRTLLTDPLRRQRFGDAAAAHAASTSRPTASRPTTTLSTPPWPIGSGGVDLTGDAAACLSRPGRRSRGRRGSTGGSPPGAPAIRPPPVRLVVCDR